jgi:hypothetical protein
MVILKVRLKIALDLTAGPDIEEIEFRDIEEIIKIFKPFPKITISGHKLLKDNYPVGEIFEISEAD